MLLHIGAPFELVKVDLDTKAQHAPEYLKINPSGHVPALIVDGAVRTECAAILMLIAERHPDAKLAPALDAMERGEFLQMMFYFANTLQPAFRSWFYPDEPAGPENKDAAMAQARAKIEIVWQRVDARLGDGRAYLAGPSLSAADFLGAMLMRWSRNMPKPATQYPHIAAYLKKIWQMPSLKAVHDREGLTEWLPR